MGRSPHKKKFLDLAKLSITVPSLLVKYLTPQEIKLLKCILAHYTIQEIVREVGLTRAEILEKLLLLGRGLAFYELLEDKIFPEDIPSADYFKGWNACKTVIRRLVNDKSTRWQTIKNRNSRA